jgi:hypothetical protein
MNNLIWFMVGAVASYIVSPTIRMYVEVFKKMSKNAKSKTDGGDSDLYEHILTFEDILKTQNHIELPSDEEVEKFINTLPFTKGLDDGQYNDGVIYGAIIGIDWMRNKIQEGKR